MKNIQPLTYTLFFLLIFHHQVSNAQCCSNGINLLGQYNTEFSAPFTTIPPGFLNDNVYSPTLGAGLYAVIVSRNYGACSQTPQFDHTTGDTSGRYLWFDTDFSATPSTPQTAWKPFNPSLPINQQNLISVTPNTDYVFSCWVRDLARNPDCNTGGAPIMGLRINGVDLAEVDLSIPIPNECCPNWVYLCAAWNSGNADTAQIRIESRTGNGFTDLGIDDIYFGTTALGFNISLGNDTTLCNAPSFKLQINSANSTFLWSNGSVADSIIVTQTGVYWVEVSENGCVSRDSISVTFITNNSFSFSLGTDTTICTNQTKILAPSPLVTGNYLWQNGSTQNTFSATQAGLYFLQITTDCGVFNDSITIAIANLPLLNLGNDTVLCSSSFRINATTNTPQSLIWSNGSNNLFLVVDTSAIYFATASNSCGAVRDSIKVDFIALPLFSLGNDTTLCNALSYKLQINSANSTFLWSNGSVADSIVVTQTGVYWVEVSENGCVSRDSISVTFITNNSFSFSLGTDTTICTNQTKILAPNPLVTGDYFWQNGSTQNTFSATQAGLYFLQITTDCGVFYDSIIIATANLPLLNLGNDTVLCSSSFRIDATTNTPQSLIWSDGSNNSFLVVDTSAIYFATASNSCGAIRDNIKVDFIALPILPFSNALIDTCSDSVISLDAKNAGANYTWSTNATTQKIKTNAAGLYTVTISYANNCTIIDSVTINYSACNNCSVLIPTAFSPNNDGINDFYKIISTCELSSFKLVIYNRWGEKVFESRKINDLWDGNYKNTPQPISTFVYNLEYMVAGTNKTKNAQGNLTLIR